MCFKYRASNHSITVETGRYEGISYEETLCPLCKTNAIGSKNHYLLACPFFDVRVRFIKSNQFQHVHCPNPNQDTTY